MRDPAVFQENRSQGLDSNPNLIACEQALGRMDK